jgi:3-phosphoshikimate 1-carboxyvinyltransferase
MFAALAPGRSVLRGLLPSLDVASTLELMKALGAQGGPLSADKMTLIGSRRWRNPDRVLDCGNSGTTARLCLGLLAGHPITVTLTGDASLIRRPMRRVTQPLAMMGARFPAGDGHLPLAIHGGQLAPIHWDSPVASAQIKSAILLAGLTGQVPVSITEPMVSRDHTERMLRCFGFDVSTADGRVTFAPNGSVEPFEMSIPGDPSSAVFLAAAALMSSAGELRIDRVGCNSTRIGFVNVIERMGGRLRFESITELNGEPVGDLIVTASELRSVAVSAREVPALIDEVPMLACLAARAAGESRFEGLAELRVKESDRLELVARNLQGIGVTASVSGDQLTVVGTDKPLAGHVQTAGDHRIAMAFAVLGTTPGARIVVDDLSCADVSFPDFAATLNSIFMARS